MGEGRQVWREVGRCGVEVGSCGVEVGKHRGKKRRRENERGRIDVLLVYGIPIVGL